MTLFNYPFLIDHTPYRDQVSILIQIPWMAFFATDARNRTEQVVTADFV